MKFRNSRIFKIITVFVLINFLGQLVIPFHVFALTSGPNQPEFSSFTPVSSTEMVNFFSGDFNYNIPIIQVPDTDGSGYPLSLSYNSGVSSEQEASWVGFGWSLNPGAISREVRGFPDDYRNVQVKYYNKNRPNWSVSNGLDVRKEEFSKDQTIATTNLRFDNYYGYQKGASVSLGLKFATLNINLDNDGATFRPQVNVLSLLNSVSKAHNKAEEEPVVEESKELFPNSSEEIKQIVNMVKGGYGEELNKGVQRVSKLSSFNIVSFPSTPKASHFTDYKGKGFNWRFAAQVNPFPYNKGIQAGLNGGFTLKYNDFLTNRATYGYLYSSEANPNSVMDYFVEKSSVFDKRDVFIGLPFGSPDQYVVVGEGLMGGFRGYNKQIGHYKPNEIQSKTIIGQLGFEVGVGTYLSVGLGLGAGFQKNKVDSWNVSGNDFSSYNNSKFKFNNDLGGKVEYTSSHEIETADLDVFLDIPGFRNAEAEPPQSSESLTAAEQRNGAYKVLDEESYSSSYIEETRENDLISGFSITNNQGFTYAYNQSIKVRNETNLSFDVSPYGTIKNNYLAFRPVSLGISGNQFQVQNLASNENKTVFGEIHNQEYANKYLISTITSPEYVDNDGIAGPTFNDFGSWTKFEYNQVYGGSGKWYRYRIPYAGLLYNRNAISNTKDDLGSVSTGEREITYLKSIETKSHIALFITNETDLTGLYDAPYMKGAFVDDPIEKVRFDGIGATDLTPTKDPSSEIIENPLGTSTLHYLDKIVLFPKDNLGNPIYDQPLKIVRFAYDYSLVPNIPNNLNTEFDYNDGANTSEDLSKTGKLTLKKIWFEYNGSVPARISPYEFDYYYPPPTEFSVGQTYFQDYADLPGNVQNPPYTPYLLDPWGNIMTGSVERKKNEIPWVDQSAQLTPNYYSEKFDPAAWNLKQITLPTGGQINVQYEEKDYAKVQDRDVLVMARLLGSGTEGFPYSDDPVYVIDPKDLGVDSQNLPMVNLLATRISEYFAETKEKIYFKFLYALKGTNPSLDDCRSEYITGYAQFNSVSVIDLNGENVIQITLKSKSGERAPIPRQACYDLVINQKQGKLESSDCIEPRYERAFGEALVDYINADYSGNLSLIQHRTLPLKMMAKMAVDPRFAYFPLDTKQEVCRVINPRLSFLRLPTIVAKKGGGPRVKRLIFSDTGFETGDPSFYGTQYHYTLEDGVTSSGVATSEPGIGREENPLVQFIKKEDQTWYDRITSGEDKEQTEGPLGESMLPGASIGYSRVAVENLGSGVSGSGYTVHEFFTAKDFPAKLERTSLNKEEDRLNIGYGPVSYTVNKSYAAQGFRVLLNDMHGQRKGVSSYSGNYGASASYLVSKQEYEYFNPGEKLKMLRWNNITSTWDAYEDTPGLEMDMAMEAKRVLDNMVDFSIEFDIGVALSFPPRPGMSLWPSFSIVNQGLSTHATTKVIRYPAIVKYVITYQQGVYNKEENLAFDHQTGNPVITRTFDGYHDLKLAGSPDRHDGSIYQVSIPASWIYEEMGRKSENISNTNQLEEKTAVYTVYGGGEEIDFNWFLNPVNVLSASVQTFDKNWFNATNPKIVSDYDIDGSESAALNNLWKPSESYVYKSDNLLASNSTEKVFQSGYFDISSQFDWDQASQPDDNWIRSSSVVSYSPNGQPLEERDILNVHNSALFKHESGKSLASMVAANASYETLFFNDFEYSNNGSSVAHSGEDSSPISLTETMVDGLSVNDHLIESGGIFLAWFYFDDGIIPADLEIQVNSETRTTLSKTAQTGAWSLFSGRISPVQFSNIGSGNPFSIILQKGDNTLTNSVFVDDIRFQPFDSEGNCYVYDTQTMRLIVQFDDQHFGTYYTYNHQGQLISKEIETERGTKMVTETHYNTPKKLR